MTDTPAVIAPGGISPDIIERLREAHEEAAALIASLRADILRLEAELALHCGTIVGNQWDGPASGFHVTHDVPPNAPPHDE